MGGATKESLAIGEPSDVHVQILVLRMKLAKI